MAEPKKRPAGTRSDRPGPQSERQMYNRWLQVTAAKAKANGDSARKKAPGKRRVRKPVPKKPVTYKPSDGKRDRSYQRREGGPLARPEPTTRVKVLSFEKLEAMRKGNLKGVNGDSARKKAPGKRKPGDFPPPLRGRGGGGRGVARREGGNR